MSETPKRKKPAIVEIAMAVQKRYGDLNGNNAASGVTLNAFLSIFPLLLVAVSVIGFISAGDTRFVTRAINDLNLTGDAKDIFTNAVNSAKNNRGTVGVIGLVTGLWSGLGVATALQLVADLPWQAATRGIKDKLNGLVFLVVAAVGLVASGGASWVLKFLPGFLAPIGLLVPVAVSTLLFVWMYWFLVQWKLTVRQVLPGAILAAIGFEVLKLLAIYWLPGVIAKSQGIYGSIGTVFGIFAWLLIFGKVIMYASVVNVVLEERRSGTMELLISVPVVAGLEPVVHTTRSGLVKPERKDLGPPVDPDDDPVGHHNVTATIIATRTTEAAEPGD